MKGLIVTSLSALALLSQALAQAATPTFSINPAEVSLTTKAQWCQGETNSCIDLCDDTPSANSCDPNTLDFTCTCANGSSPGLQYYLQTMPTFICNQAYEDCITANTNSASAQENCTTSIKDQCGSLDPASYLSAAQSSTSAAPSASAAAATTSAKPTTSAVSTSTSKGAAAAPTDCRVAAGNGAALAAVGLFAYLL